MSLQDKPPGYRRTPKRYDSPFLDEHGFEPEGQEEWQAPEPAFEGESPFAPSGEAGQEDPPASAFEGAFGADREEPAWGFGGSTGEATEIEVLETAAEYEAASEGEFGDASPFEPREGEGETEPERESLTGGDLWRADAAEAEGESQGDAKTDDEFVLLREREESALAEAGEEGESEFALVNEADETPAEEGQVGFDTIPTIGRVLWPALGFPAVITPGSNPRSEPSLEVDATRCLTILVLTNTPKLPPSEVAKRLRVVPWSMRHVHYVDSSPFTAADFVVRTDSPATKLTLAQPADATEQLIAFGEGAGRVNTMIVNLARKVREIYKGWSMEFLHEIRLSESATARLGAGQFHVFFNNIGSKKDAPSDEMSFLISLGKRRRQEELQPLLAPLVPDAQEEYQYEYGTTHKPYCDRRKTKVRAELLHPFFIRKTTSPTLRLGHVTDLHVDVRTDVYEHNLARKGKLNQLSFNNWNTSVAQIYAFAKRDSDALLLTGDLVDYGRGHVGIRAAGRLGENGLYHRDRNWLLFYDMLVGEDRYTVPVYTSLGNHDWRINPYPPFAVAGPPSPRTLINDYDCFKPEELEQIIRLAHGDGHDLDYSYDPRWKTVDLVDVIRTLRHAHRQETKLEERGLPTETNIDSVLWYLLTINPFLDYSWALPSSHRLLMLDWGEDEGILFKTIEDGVVSDYSGTPGGLRRAADAGPKAIRSLTSVQKLMVEHFIKIKSQAKVIGIHAPPIGPWTDWGDDDLRAGFKQYKKRPTRGPVKYVHKKNGKVIALNGHPLFAIPPKRGPKGHLSGMDADYNTFMRDRDWFVRALADPAAGVRLVLSGHIHRNGRLGVRIGTKADGEIVEGEYLLRSLEHNEVQGVKAPGISTRTNDFLAPLYVNTTSAGLRGNNYPAEEKHLQVDPGFARVELKADGTIVSVSFRRPVNAKTARCDIGKARVAKGLPEFAF